MFKKTLVGLALVAPLSAFAAPIVFDNSSLGGSNSFAFDQIQISGGNSKVTLSDSNNSGFVDFGDTFVETGLVAGVAFTDAAANVINNSGMNTTGGYQLFAVFNPLVGQVTTAVPGLFYQVAFGAASGFTLYYDTDLTAGLQGSTIIGRGTNGSGDCTVAASASGGGGFCVLDFDFDAAAVSAAGVFTSGGIDLGLLGSSIRVDMNVDRIAPGFFSPTYASVGGTQERFLDHNGSASFQVPEPSSLALLGLGGLMGLVRRRKAA